MKKRTLVWISLLCLALLLSLAFTACGQASGSGSTAQAPQETAEAPSTPEAGKDTAQAEKAAEMAPTAPENAGEAEAPAQTPTDAPATPAQTSTPTQPQAPAQTPAPALTETPASPVPGHAHSWQPVYKTVHHDEVTEKVWVVDCAAYDEPIQEPRVICRCGALFLSYAEWQGHCSSYFDTPEESQHTSCSSAPVTVGYEHHDEEGHWETKTVKPAYDEQVIDHYKCSCGETKEA